MQQIEDIKFRIVCVQLQILKSTKTTNYVSKKIIQAKLLNTSTRVFNSVNLSVSVCFSSNKHAKLVLRKINSSDSVVDRPSFISILCLTLGQTCTIPDIKYLYCYQLFCFAFQHLSFMKKNSIISLWLHFISICPIHKVQTATIETISLLYYYF